MRTGSFSKHQRHPRCYADNAPFPVITESRSTVNLQVQSNGPIYGYEVVDRIDEYGSAQGGLSEHTADEIKSRRFVLRAINLCDLVKTDKDFAEFATTYKPRDYAVDDGLMSNGSRQAREPQDLYDEPIVIIGGEVRDGYGRAASHLINDDAKIMAYVAVDNPTNTCNNADMGRHSWSGHDTR